MNLVWSLVIFFSLLPTYLIRFDIGVPTTVLELLFFVVIFFWLKENGLSVFGKIKQVFRKYTTLSVATSLFLLAATISILSATEVRAALGEWRAFYVQPIILAAILATTKLEKKHKHYMFFGLIISGLAVSLLSIYQHFTGWMVPHAFWANRDTYRVTAWYGFPNGVGIFLAPLIPLALYLVVEHFKKKNVLFYTSLLFIPLALLAILYAKSTGALIGVLGAIGLLLLFYKKTRIAALSLGIIGLISILLLPAQNPIRQELLFQDRSAQLRLDMWNETFHFLRDHPIAGTGIASYEEKIYPYRKDKWIEVFHHPHNLLLTIYVNTGLLGILSFLTLVVGIFASQYHYFKKHKQLPLAHYFLLASFAAILVMGIVDSPYIKNDWAFFFWMIPGLLLSHSYGNMENTETKKTS